MASTARDPRADMDVGLADRGAMRMYEASRANPAGRIDDGLSYEAYQAARERFLARLRADSETRRLEALWRTPSTPEEEGPHR